jgi:hypothetical protein
MRPRVGPLREHSAQAAPDERPRVLDFGAVYRNQSAHEGAKRDRRA